MIMPSPFELPLMSGPLEFDSASLSTQVVLAGVTELSLRDETPAHAGEIRRATNDVLESADADVPGTVTEAEVSRTLNEIEASGVVEGSRDDSSPTGKGRPTYTLVPAVEGVRAALAGDDRVAPLVDSLDATDD